MYIDLPERPEATERGRYRPPVGIPEPVARRRWPSTLLSLAFHLLIVLAIVAPFATPMVLREVEGAGGPGPAGGGGGGTGGTGGLVQERLRYLQVAPPPPAPPTPSPRPQLVVPVPPPPKPEPKPEPKAVTPPAPTPPAPAPPAPAEIASAAVPGTGGGTGNDGTAGSGPGSGGGVGSGVGTGRGSGVGPGTGGGNATIYPPQAIEVFIPPLPVPGKVKGAELLVVFDVDSTGRVLRFDFAPTRDGGYNRKLREVLAAVRFRPATRADGTPIRAQGSITYIF